MRCNILDENGPISLEDWLPEDIHVAPEKQEHLDRIYNK